MLHFEAGHRGTLEVLVQEGDLCASPPQLQREPVATRLCLSDIHMVQASGLPASSRKSSSPDADRGQSQEGLTQNVLGLVPRLSGTASDPASHLAHF